MRDDVVKVLYYVDGIRFVLKLEKLEAERQGLVRRPYTCLGLPPGTQKEANPAPNPKDAYSVLSEGRPPETCSTTTP